MSTANQTENEESEFASSNAVPIAQASRLLRVPMPTLRSWELRYGVPDSDRQSGRHRRYTSVEMHALRLMRDEIARGTRASLAARSVRALLGVDGPAGELIQSLLAASSRLDTIGIRDQLTRSADLIGIGPMIDEVLLPAMRQIGQWWDTGRCEIKQEHLTTEAARSWLDKRMAFSPPPTAANPVILACGPGDLHTIGLEALALLLRERGWGTRVLGARTSTDSLVTSATAAAAGGVVVVAHLPTGRRRALASIGAVHDLGIPVFYAGNAFSTPRNRAQMPGVYLGTKLQDAADLIAAELSK